MLTESQIKEIEDRVNAATAGEWYFQSTLDGRRYSIYSSIDQWLCSSVKSVNDGLFIAHSRTDIPLLIADWKRMRAVVDAARESMQLSIEDYECRIGEHEEQGGQFNDGATDELTAVVSYLKQMLFVLQALDTAEKKEE